MTIPNIGNIDINAYVELLKRARDAGRTILGGLREQLKSNPDIQILIDQIRKLTSKSTVTLTDAELTNLIESWRSGLMAKSKPFPGEDTPPPPPPPPISFPYGTELNWHPLIDDLAHLLRPTDRIWRRKDGSTGWVATNTGSPPQPSEMWELDPAQPDSV